MGPLHPKPPHSTLTNFSNTELNLARVRCSQEQVDLWMRLSLVTCSQLHRLCTSWNLIFHCWVSLTSALCWRCWHWCNIFVSWITGTGGSIHTPSILKAHDLQARQIVGIGSTHCNACHYCITAENGQSYLWVYDKTISSAGRSPVVNLNALNINTGTSSSNSNVESIKVAWGVEGKQCSICSLCKSIWLLNASYELIVASGCCCCIVPSISLIAIHINVELVTGGILSQSAFSKTSTDINKHFSGLEVADVLRENPVILWCALSEITHPCLRCAEATQRTCPLQHKKRNNNNNTL